VSESQARALSALRASRPRCSTSRYATTERARWARHLVDSAVQWMNSVHEAGLDGMVEPSNKKL
jgi:hypothetical protein